MKVEENEDMFIVSVPCQERDPSLFPPVLGIREGIEKRDATYPYLEGSIDGEKTARCSL